MVGDRGESNKERPEKQFKTIYLTKLQPPELMFEVLKKTQTCGNLLGGVEEGMARKTIWDNAFYEKLSTRSSG